MQLLFIKDPPSKPWGVIFSPSLSLYEGFCDWCRVLSDLQEILGALCEIVDVSVGGNCDHILDAAAVLALDINTRLNRDNMPRQQELTLFGRGRKARAFVHIETHAVTQRMPEAALISCVFDDIARYAVKCVQGHP